MPFRAIEDAQERDILTLGDRNAPQKHVWRAEIILLSADGVGTVEIMRETGKSKTNTWRWQERFAEEGSEGCCATRRGLRAFHRSGRKWPSAWLP
jgi:transposase